MSDHEQAKTYEGWTILELMGHRRLGGYVTEVEVASAKFLRIDVPGMKMEDGIVATQFYSPSSVYCMTPTTEAMARAVATREQPEPVRRWELPSLEAKKESTLASERDDSDYDDEDGPYF